MSMWPRIFWTTSSIGRSARSARIQIELVDHLFEQGAALDLGANRVEPILGPERDGRAHELVGHALRHDRRSACPPGRRPALRRHHERENRLTIGTAISSHSGACRYLDVIGRVDFFPGAYGQLPRRRAGRHRVAAVERKPEREPDAHRLAVEAREKSWAGSATLCEVVDVVAVVDRRRRAATRDRVVGTGRSRVVLERAGRVRAAPIGRSNRSPRTTSRSAIRSAR